MTKQDLCAAISARQISFRASGAVVLDYRSR